MLDDPSLNERDLLLERVRELDKKTPEQLQKSLQRIEQALEQEEQERMKKFYV